MVGKKKSNVIKLNPKSSYRKVADEVWELAREYEDSDHHDIAEVLKKMSDELHNLAREHEKEEKKN